MSVYTCVQSDFQDKDKMNCAEKVLNAANISYNMGLSKEACKLCAGFGAGLGCESLCGAVAAGTMVLSHFFVKEYAHEGDRVINRITKDFVEKVDSTMGSHLCCELKPKYRTEEEGCKVTIELAAKALEEILETEWEKQKTEAAQAE